MSQLHKRFTSEQLKEFFDRYLKNEIKRRRFFLLLKQYKGNPQNFTVQYRRTKAPRTLCPAIEQNILKELSMDKKMIQNKEIPLKSYNYSYIKDRLRITYHQKVSLPTIIDRAKKHGFYLKKPKKTAHDREVITHYIGELIQHDASHHL